MRLPAAAVFTGLALAAAGCGGSEQTAGVLSSPSAGADVVPASAQLVAAVDSNLDSDQWQAVDDLLGQFGARDRLVQRLRAALAREDVSYSRDVEPALGDQVVVALLDVSDGVADAVLLTKPESQAKLRELLSKTDFGQFDTRIIEGWTAVADAGSGALTRFDSARRRGTLDSANAFEDAADSLPADALAAVFVNGELARGGVQHALNERGLGGATPRERVEWATAALRAESDGLKLEGTVKADRSLDGYSPSLLDDVPGDAIALLSFKGGAKSLERALQENPLVQGHVSRLEQLLGTRVERLAALFRGEGALYVRPGLPIPEVTLLLDQSDPEGGVATLDALAARSALFGARPRATRIDGVAAKEVRVGRFSIAYAAVDGKLVVTTSLAAIGELRSGGDKLTDNEVFKDAEKTAGVPDEVAGLVYLNLEDGIGLVRSLAQAAGDSLPPDVDQNLQALHSFVAYLSPDGDETHVAAFLGIQ